uniref:Uncharacterized protein n=1 Tax=Rhizophora mucronata TaxID=61149 RepID=A0A2P2JTP1_RHIMU
MQEIHRVGSKFSRIFDEFFQIFVQALDKLLTQTKG